jgi:signal transduction histidine kinase
MSKIIEYFRNGKLINIYYKYVNTYYKKIKIKLNPYKQNATLTSILTSWIRLFFIFVFTIFGVAILIMYFNFSNKLNSFEKNTYEVIKESLFENIETAMLVKDLQVVRNNIDRMRDLDAINDIYLVNREMKIIMAEDINSEGTFVNYSSLQNAMNTGDELREKISSLGNYEIRMILPFKNNQRCQYCHSTGNRVLGGLVVSFATVDIISTSQRTFIFFIIFFILIIMFSVLFFKKIIGKTVNEPVDILVETTKKIATGNLKIKTQIDTPMEMGILANSIDKMANDIRGYINDIKKGVSEKEQIRNLAGIGEMAAKVAHEVRNPLNIIDGAIYYIQKTYANNPDFDEYVELIRENITRINNVASELLDITKSKKPELKRIELKSLLEQRIKHFTEQNLINNININLFSDKQVPQIFVDVNQIIQVIDNLIENSIDACNGGIDNTIIIQLKTISSTPMHNYVSIRIFDNGNGMAKDELQNVFTPFFTTKPKGTGLGLVIVKTIVNNHMGEIKFSSKKNFGTIVSIKLPLTY